MKTNWTEPQLKAMEAKGSVIVTAAAGSGKTAVLVERVIKKLCDGEHPVSADRLLIVTFTNAAAAEMRGRIEKRLAEECVKNPDNFALLKQQLLISAADISTIDSFCIKLVRNNFNLADISPDFKIADDSSQIKIKDAVMQELFNEYFEKDDVDFKNFLYSSNSSYGDENASEMVWALYNYVITMPEPEIWLGRAVRFYNPDKFENSILVNTVCDWISSDINSFLDIVCEIYYDLNRDAVLSEKCAEQYGELLSFLKAVLLMCTEKNWDEIYNLLLDSFFSFPNIRASKNVDAFLLNRARTLYKLVVETIENWKKWVMDSSEYIKGQLVFTGESVKMLVTLCRKFSKRYFAELKKRGLLTFSLVEQLALNLLTELDDDGNLVPSDLQKTVSDMYDEVMVDEFQDVNDLQSTLFDIISDGGKKLFVVGDAKQSIYGFRRANPEHFINKSKSAEFYNTELSEDTLKRIVLSNNFRSRAGVCDFINGLFYLNMSSEFGGVDYDSNEMLYPLAAFPENNEAAGEIHLLNYKGEKSTAEYEAEYLAQYILKTLEKPAFLRKDANTLRKAEFSDFAILMRTSKKFHIYISALKKYGIPVSVGYGNYFKTTEIMTAFSLLKAIYNPMNDIAMLAVMLSPIFSFTEDDVADLKLVKQGIKLFSAALMKADLGDKKCIELKNRFANWRRAASTMSMADFVVYLLNDSEYYLVVSAMNDFERRRGNLLLLEEMASAFSADFSGDLGGFIGYLEYVEAAGKTNSYSVKTNESVKFMSFHSSKGLQFPICILLGGFNNFNSSDEKRRFIFDEKLGISLNIVYDEENFNIKTAPKNIINYASLKHHREEELRLLYVAMTRAEEKLVVLLSHTNMSKKIKDAYNELLLFYNSSGHFNPDFVSRAKNYGDWIIKYLILLPCFKNVLDELNLQKLTAPVFLSGLKSFPAVFIDDGVTEFLPSEKISYQNLKEIDVNLNKKMKDILSYNYPYAELRNIETKTSVSQIAKKNAQREFCASSRPAFMSSGGLTSKEKGTALHKFMQYANFVDASNNITAEIERLYEYGYISREEADCIDVRKIEAFFGSEIFSRILKSDKLYREQRFLLDVKAGEIYSDLSDYAKEQTVIIQGAVDCMFEENGKIIIIDFKTDRVKSEEKLLAHYSEQLNFYSVAAEKMFGLPVTERYLYSLQLNKFIIV